MKNNFIFKNFLSGAGSQLILNILNIIVRTYFIKYLGTEVLGLSATITSFIGALAILEGGISTSVSYSLYKPLAEKNRKSVYILISFISKIYKLLAVVILILGLLSIPLFLQLINNPLPKNYSIFIYLLVLLDTVCIYFLSGKKVLLIADQKKYIINIYTTIFNLILVVLKLILIINYSNYLYVLIATLLTNITLNILINHYISKSYTYFLKTKHKYTIYSHELSYIRRNFLPILINKFTVYAVFSTDNLLIASITNTVVVGVYSNYLVLINLLKQIISHFFTSIPATYARQIHENSSFDSFYYFLRLNRFCHFLTALVSVVFMFLVNVFLVLWLDDITLIFGNTIVFLISLNIYLDISRSSVEVVRTVYGIYSPDKYFKYFLGLEALINLSLSLVFAVVFNLGLVGILLGTTFSLIFSTIVLNKYIFKYAFNKKPSEFILWAKNIVFLLLCSFISNIFVSKFLGNVDILSFLILSIVVVLCTTVVLLIINVSKEDFDFMIRLLKKKK